LLEQRSLPLREELQVWVLPQEGGLEAELVQAAVVPDGVVLCVPWLRDAAPAAVPVDRS